jgi:hypothetical protein
MQCSEIYLFVVKQILFELFSVRTLGHSDLGLKHLHGIRAISLIEIPKDLQQ